MSCVAALLSQLACIVDFGLKMTHWQDTFDDKELQWKQIFTCPYTLTIDTKLRAFQYKYILKILPDNSFLHKYCSVPSSLCDFCFMTRDSLCFGNATSFKPFGEMLQSFYKTNCLLIMNLDIRKFLFVMTHIQM